MVTLKQDLRQGLEQRVGNKPEGERKLWFETDGKLMLNTFKTENKVPIEIKHIYALIGHYNPWDADKVVHLKDFSPNIIVPKNVWCYVLHVDDRCLALEPSKILTHAEREVSGATYLDSKERIYYP